MRRVAVVAFTLTAIAGCGEPPSPKFVVTERTKKLDRTARGAVETELQHSFGDPNHLVGWRKLPVDYGQFDAVVAQAPAQLGDAMVVDLAAKPDSVMKLSPERINGAAIVWNTGTNKDLVVTDAKGRDVPIEFIADRYDPNESKLYLRVEPAEAAGQLQPPKKGDTFAVLGTGLQHGRRAYMTHCVHCHGVSGDGNGPTARYLSPRPRDYRLGRFKFTSTRTADKARRDDLSRIVHQGIPGTYMPSFLLLNDEDVAAVVEYVRWLAMRGEFEQKLDVEFEAEQYTTDAIGQRVKGGETREQIEAALTKYVADFPKLAGEKAEEVATAWSLAEQADSVIVPKKARTPDSPESRERGRKLYFSDTAKCATCHGPTGRGDGPQTEDYQTIPGSSKKYTEPGLFDDWGNRISPRDLTMGIYRGGRRPIDLYRRVFSGIKGTPMPAFGAALNDDQIWDVINYVTSLPFEKGSPSTEPQQHRIASVGADAGPDVGHDGGGR